MLSRKAIAELSTRNPQDCTSTGYDFTLYADGHVSAVYRSRWQGSRDGARYITDAGAVDLSDWDEADPDSDAEALLAGWLGIGPDGIIEDPIEEERGERGNQRTWRRTRAGVLVQ